MPMKIGIVSNSKSCLALLFQLNNFNRGGVSLYLGSTADPGVNKAEVMSFCYSNHIAIHVEEQKEELYQWQQLFEPDIIFITGYGNKIDTSNLKGVPRGVYNIHFGKLPEFRGPSPVFWQLKKGMPDLVLTIHELSDKFDGGPIVWEQKIKNEDYHSYNYVNQLFSELQVKAVVELLQQIGDRKTLNKIVQDEGKAAYYKRPELANVMINWELMDANEIINLVKACNSWNNGAITLLNGFELKIMDANIVAGKKAGQSGGTITLSVNGFFVDCIKGAVISVNFFDFNQNFAPGRYAGFYGIKTGQKFTNNLDSIFK